MVLVHQDIFTFPFVLLQSVYMALYVLSMWQPDNVHVLLLLILLLKMHGLMKNVFEFSVKKKHVFSAVPVPVHMLHYEVKKSITFSYVELSVLAISQMSMDR